MENDLYKFVTSKGKIQGAAKCKYSLLCSSGTRRTFGGAPLRNYFIYTKESVYQNWWFKFGLLCHDQNHNKPDYICCGPVL